VRRKLTVRPYASLVRYIDTYRDPRAEVEGEEDEQDEKPAPWYKFGGKGAKANLSSFVTPRDWLTTNIDRGLDSAEVERRRKHSGWNELVTEKENLFLKFVGFFQGPILYGAFCRSHNSELYWFPHANYPKQSWKLLLCWLLASRIGWMPVLSAPFCY
jgi:magnesium-transporting ATPase (P-type)